MLYAYLYAYYSNKTPILIDTRLSNGLDKMERNITSRVHIYMVHSSMLWIVFVGMIHFPECSQAGSEVSFPLYIFLYPAAQPALTSKWAWTMQKKLNKRGGHSPPVKWEKRQNCLFLTACLCCWLECYWICLSLEKWRWRKIFGYTHLTDCCTYST